MLDLALAGLRRRLEGDLNTLAACFMGALLERDD